MGKIFPSSERIVQLAVAARWPVEDARASLGQSGRAPAGRPAMDVHGTKAPGTTIQDQATHRHRW